MHDLTPEFHSQEQAQAQRLKRFALGWGAYALVLPYVALLHLGGALDGSVVVFSALAWLVSALVFVGLFRSGLNLRFADPTLNMPLVVSTLLPSILICYACETPAARATALFTTIFALVSVAFRLSRRQLMTLTAGVLASYLAILAALASWAPQRLSWGTEPAMLWVYGVNAVLAALLGNYIAGLRRRLCARNAELQEAMVRLDELATIDPLTRLPNRRTLMERLEHERNRCERRTPVACALSVCLLDIDHFKRFNDNHGHQVGDAVLQAVAAGLHDALRVADFVGRYGGEEFVLVLPESTPEGAMMAAERVRQAIERIVVPELPPGERVTASVGVALHVPGRTTGATLGAADAALYRAKRGGRNRVEMEHPAHIDAARDAGAALGFRITRPSALAPR